MACGTGFSLAEGEIVGRRPTLGSLEIEVTSETRRAHEVGERAVNVKRGRVLRSVKTLILPSACENPRYLAVTGARTAPGESRALASTAPLTRKEGLSTCTRVPASVGGHAAPRREASGSRRWSVDGAFVLSRPAALCALLLGRRG